MDTSARRGRACGRGGSSRRRWLRSGSGEREGAEERGDAVGEEEGRGDTRPRRGVAREAGGKQEVAGKQEAAGARGRARRARARPPGREEDDRGGRRRWAGPAGGAGPAGLDR